jgi:hypothetical protein
LLLQHLDELLLRLKDLAQHSLLSGHECLYHHPGGSGGTSLQLLDTPKPSGELHVGPTI